MDYRKGRVCAKDFLIMPWGGMPVVDKPGNFWGNVSNMDDVMRDLWECGFNITGFTNVSNMDCAAKYGLSVFIDDSSISRNIEAQISDDEAAKIAAEVVSPLKGNPNVLGYYLRDEPSVGMYDNLAKWAKAVYAADPDTLAYINLFPECANMQQLGAEDYNDYLEKFVNTCSPKFLSYDCYALFEGGILKESQFYSNIEAMRAKALKYNIPFWNIVLANSHFKYAEPSQATLNVQAFSTLAYGAKGISYFTYYAPIVGNYRLAAIDQFMNRTKTWEMLRLVNLQIHTLAPVYLTLKSVNVFHSGNIPAKCKGIETSKHVKSIQGKNMLVGEFDGPDGVPYAMVVNKDMNESVCFDIEFKKPGTVMLTSSYTGEEMEFTGEQKWLAPGQGMLLHVK